MLIKGLANTRKRASLLLPVDFGNIGLLGRTRNIGDADAQDTANFVIAKKIDDVTRISLRLHDFCLPQHGKLLRDCILLEIEDLAELPNRIFPCDQQLADLEPNRMRQRLEDFQHTVRRFGGPGISRL